MSIAREGFVYIATAAFLAAGMYAAALNRRSWALWLFAFALTIVALAVAYLFRDGERTGPRGAQGGVAQSYRKVVRLDELRGPGIIAEYTQRTGRVARRMVTDSKEGVQVRHEQRMGLLRFVAWPA